MKLIEIKNLEMRFDDNDVPILQNINLDINANEWQGKWFNSITCWKATLRNPGQPTAAQQPQTYYHGASSTAAPVQTAIPQPPVDFGEQKDDLPF